MSKLMNHADGEIALLDLNSVLNHHRVPFFLIQGTALGAYRDNGFCPTEKDIDIGILYENFVHQHKFVIDDLQRLGFDCSIKCLPFDKTRVVKVDRSGIHIDITTYVLWKQSRFCANTDPRFTYAVVHEKEIMENYEFITLFGKTFRIPHPIERYLELEYGENWQIPADDSLSRTRIYDYVKKEGILNDYLNSFEEKYTA